MTKSQLFRLMDAVKMFHNDSNKEIMYHLPADILAEIEPDPKPVVKRRETEEVRV